MESSQWVCISSVIYQWSLGLPPQGVFVNGQRALFGGDIHQHSLHPLWKFSPSLYSFPSKSEQSAPIPRTKCEIESQFEFLNPVTGPARSNYWSKQKLNIQNVAPPKTFPFYQLSSLEDFRCRNGCAKGFSSKISICFRKCIWKMSQKMRKCHFLVNKPRF